MRAAALTLLALLAPACRSPSASAPPAPTVDTPSPRRNATMSMDPAVFEQVTPGLHARNAASPAAPADPRWRGVLLAAPRVVRPRGGRAPSIPLCLYAMLDVPLEPHPRGWRAVVSGPTLAEPLDVPMVDVDQSPDEPPPPPPPRDPETFRGVAAGGYQNHDLGQLASLPRGAGVYTVHVELGPARSNEVTVQVDPQP